jgi:hypothetical protein
VPPGVEELAESRGRRVSQAYRSPSTAAPHQPRLPSHQPHTPHSATPLPPPQQAAANTSNSTARSKQTNFIDQINVAAMASRLTGHGL